MIDIEAWAGDFAQKLQTAFGTRLRFLGYQGSYGRGEATESSDIDMVTVLDRVTAADLRRYRELVRVQISISGEFCAACKAGGQNPATWPQANVEACGFICGEAEIRAWPRYDLLGLALDTKPVLGSLEALTPDFTPEDARMALAIGASGLYHAACHSYLYGDPKAALPGLGKAAFFCLRLFALCRDSVYYPSRRALKPVLCGHEQELLELTPENLAGFTDEQAERAYDLLIGWSGEQLMVSQKP